MEEKEMVAMLEKCRNTFFSALILNQEGYNYFVLTDWINGDWSIFIGPEEIAKRMLAGDPKAIIESIRWKFYPTRSEWPLDFRNPKKIAEWILNQQKDVVIDKNPFPEYTSWLKGLTAKLATEPDTLPTISFSAGRLTAWIHHKNNDLTPTGAPIEHHEENVPLPRGFEEEKRKRQLATFSASGTTASTNAWPNFFPITGSGWTVRSTGISDDWSDSE